MREDLKRDDFETLAGVKERIAALQEQHNADLERMYAWHAAEYLQEAKDQYLSKDESLYLAKGENNPALVASYEKLEVS
jgi:hypothetical protein